MAQREERRVVVTGLGIVSPLGTGLEKNWQAAMAGRSGIRKISRFANIEAYGSRIAGEVPDFLRQQGLFAVDLARVPDAHVSLVFWSRRFQALLAGSWHQRMDFHLKVPGHHALRSSGRAATYWATKSSDEQPRLAFRDWFLQGDNGVYDTRGIIYPASARFESRSH